MGAGGQEDHPEMCPKKWAAVPREQVASWKGPMRRGHECRSPCVCSAATSQLVSARCRRTRSAQRARRWRPVRVRQVRDQGGLAVIKTRRVPNASRALVSDRPPKACQLARGPLHWHATVGPNRPDSGWAVRGPHIRVRAAARARRARKPAGPGGARIGC